MPTCRRSRSRAGGILAALLVAACAAATSAQAIDLPPDFEAYPAVSNVMWDSEPTGVAFLPGGRMLVIEKAGRVWSVKNGVRSAQPMLDITPQVLNNDDRGLLGIAVDPDYVNNHFVYLLYTVDSDSNNVETNGDAYGRLARFTVSFADSNTITYSSRVVLFGHNWRAGPVSASPSHAIGDLQFGRDGSLLVSIGEGAQFSTTDAGGQDAQAFSATRTDPYEDIGAYRAQYIGCLGGKILRIRPSTGAGYPSNPYWTGDSTAIQSRIWAYGLRNPFRFTVRPGTGNPDPNAGNPGTLYIGDVGWSDREEMNVAKTPGQNFGWPCFEGFGVRNSYQNASPAHHGCSTIGTPSNPASQSAPLAAWDHGSPSLSVPPGFMGNASIGGVFQLSSAFPSAYRGYFFADYGADWIQVAQVDANDNLVQIIPFGTGADGPVNLEVDPVNGDLVYVAINSSTIWRIRYTGGTGGNQPPLAVANGSPSAGAAPLTVNFSSSGTFDPDNDPFTVSWTFGDGQGSSSPNPSHSYPQPGTYAAVLTADAGAGGIGRDTVNVTVLASGSFPTSPVLDTFNRANGAIGGSWVDPINGLSQLSINNNALVQACCNYKTPVWNGGSFGPDQEAYITIVQGTSTAPEHDLMLKLQTASYASAHIEVRWDDVRNGVYCATYTPGSGWVDLGAPIPATFGPGDQLGARAFASGTLEVFKNGVLLGTRDFSAWAFKANGGWIGLTLDGAYSSRLDDFGGGNVVISTNQAPVASINAPVDNGFYTVEQPVFLSGTAIDESPGTVSYHWDVRLHHNNHTHFDSFEADGDTASFVPEDHEDGSGVWYEVRLYATDTQGLIDTTSVSLYADVDLTPTAPVLTPDPPAADANAVLSFWLRNHGSMRSRIHHWTLRREGTVLAEGDTLLAGRDSVSMNMLLGPGTFTPGSQTLRLVVDTLGVVTETNEANNAATRELVAGSGGVTGTTDAPRSLALSAARPNPAREGVHLTLDLPRSESVALAVFDLQGREVWSRPAHPYGAGRWDLAWDGRVAHQRAPAGVYLFRARIGSAQLTRRFLIVR
jgi:glucose/arabinose dehydrogenase/chitodextrinase